MVAVIEEQRENKKARDKDNPHYHHFQIVEVEGGNHLFSYDSNKPIERVSDVVDSGEITPAQFKEFKSLAK